MERFFNLRDKNPFSIEFSLQMKSINQLFISFSISKANKREEMPPKQGFSIEKRIVRES